MGITTVLVKLVFRRVASFRIEHRAAIEFGVKLKKTVMKRVKC
jgi:hypothetical protein